MDPNVPYCVVKNLQVLLNGSLRDVVQPLLGVQKHEEFEIFLDEDACLKVPDETVPGDSISDGPTCAAQTEIQTESDAVAQHHDHKLSRPEAAFTICSLLLNYGILTVPYMYSLNGLIAVVPAIIAATMCTMTVSLLDEVLQALEAQGTPQPGYQEIGRIVGGKFLGGLMIVSNFGEVYTYPVGNVLVVVHTLASTFPWLTKNRVLFGSCCFGVLQSAVSDRSYAYLNLASSVVIFLLIFAVIMSGVALPEHADDTHFIENDGYHLPSALSLFVFGIVVHPMLPSIRSNMKDPTVLNSVVRGSMLVWTVTSLTFGIAVYYLFGHSTQTVVTANVAHDIFLRPVDGMRPYSLAAAALVLLRCQFSMVTPIRPMMGYVASLMGSTAAVEAGGKQAVLSSIPVMSAVFLGAYLLMDYLALLEVFCGAITQTLNAFIFPGLAHIVVCKPKGCARFPSWFSVFFGFMMATAVLLQQCCL